MVSVLLLGIQPKASSKDPLLPTWRYFGKVPRGALIGAWVAILRRMTLTRCVLWRQRLLLGVTWHPLFVATRPMTTAQAGTATLDTDPTAHAPDSIPSHYKPAHKEAPLISFQTGQVLGTVQLHQFVFGAPARVDIIHRVMVWQRAKRRVGLAKVKDRGEVRGGGKKPWQQKGTGRARQGSIRAPHWRGGGVVHGPRGPKSYDYTLPKKVKNFGLRAALSIKYAQGDLTVVDALQAPSSAESEMLSILDREQWKSVLMVDGGDVDENLFHATLELDKVDVLPSRGLNVYDMLLRDRLVLSIGAVRLLEERLLQECFEQ